MLNSKKKIVFLTGTRADFGKLKSLIKITQEHPNFEVHIFATGMHLDEKYGETVDEIYKAGFKNIHRFKNHDDTEFMDRKLAKTIRGFSEFIIDLNPDLIVVHGDRVEPLAGAIVGSLNNILVAHVEGGEISGTIDELIRHSISKMSHIHLVANKEAKERLIQLGEYKTSVFIIGSPDLDLMNPQKLPSLDAVKKYYGIEYEDYAIAMFHPVTTEYKNIKIYTKEFVESLIESKLNYIVIFPNNDLGTIEILNEYNRIKNNKNFKIFPSLRFEYFLRLLKESDFIIGNSSAGIREASFYDVPTIDIGTRQNNRAKLNSIYHCGYKKKSILSALEKIKLYKNYKNSDINNKSYFGGGKSDEIFLKILDSEKLWKIKHQKQFQEFSK